MDQILALILGPLASFIQGSFLKDSEMSSKWKVRLRFMLSWAVCLVASIVIQFVDAKQGGSAFDWSQLGANLGLMFTSSQATYNLYFKPKKV